MGAGRVLVVDDDDVIRQLITVNLELEGFDVVTAVDGQDALDKVKEARPHVVTLDVMMPRVDGWEAAARLRSDPETQHIKVILLSARAQEADIQRGERIGVDAYLTKPFDPDELIDTVRRLVGNSGSASACPASGRLPPPGPPPSPRCSPWRGAPGADPRAPHRASRRRRRASARHRAAPHQPGRPPPPPTPPLRRLCRPGRSTCQRTRRRGCRPPGTTTVRTAH